MFFSIIVPIYNVEKYLHECVDSILKQTFTDFEIILVDDGSPDACPDICDEYTQKDSRIKVVHKENGGASDARNIGLEYARGEYIVFMDSDDYWDDKDALKKIHKIILEKNPEIVTWRFKKYLEQTKDIKKIGRSIKQAKIEDFAECIKTKNFTVSPCCKAIKRSLMEKNKLKFLKGAYAEDIEWCARVLTFTKKIYPSNLDFYVYRQRSESMSHSIREKTINDIKSHLLFIESIIQEKQCAENESLERLLAEEFCNFVVTLTMYKHYQKEISWVQEKKYVLKWATSTRCKILKYMFSLLGVKLTIKVISIIR